MSQILRYFTADSVDLPALSAWLDGLAPAQRRDELLGLGRRQQARLFEAAAGFRPLGLDDLVPATVADGQEVIHHGRNSLPAYSHFEKRFLRPAAGTELLGYNEGSARRFVGPGYFTASAGQGEVLVDYRRVPAERPAASWPAPRSNAVGLSLLVFHQLTDVLRGVSEGVSIGRGYRHGKPLDAWFLLVRE